MISNLSQIFNILREKYINFKKIQVKCILNFIEKTEASGACLVCGISFNDFYFEEESECFNPFQLDYENKSCLSEDKICELCCVKIHSKPPKFFFLDFIAYESTPDRKLIKNHKILLDLIIYQNQMLRKSENIEKICDFHQIMKDIQCIKDGIEVKHHFNNNFSNSLIKSYQNYLSKLKSKEIIKKQIKYKIETIEEQLELIQENHRKAILDGELDEAKGFKEVYSNLFELKLTLIEKLYKYSHTGIGSGFVEK